MSLCSLQCQPLLQIYAHFMHMSVKTQSTKESLTADIAHMHMMTDPGLPAHAHGQVQHVHPEWCCRSCAGDARIHTLNLSANNIGDRGAAALAEMLKVGSKTSHNPCHLMHLVQSLVSYKQEHFALCCAVLCCVANTEVALLEQTSSPLCSSQPKALASEESIVCMPQNYFMVVHMLVSRHCSHLLRYRYGHNKYPAERR